ncbi:MAG: hypothetical protein JW751_04360 [Polyangiaceae bacterium]|nr:hypothetical protein [Polyangiaceae bacterium]
MVIDVRRSRRWSVAAFGAAFAALVLGGFGAGCKKEQKQSGEIVEPKDQGPVVDPALARAMATASASASARAGGQAGDGPPESGVFAPGEADRQITRGAPAKLTVGGSGSEPRMRLTGHPPAGKSTLRVRVAAQRGNNQEVPIDVELALEVAKPGTAVSGVGSPSAPAASAAPDTEAKELAVVAKVATAKVDATMVSSVPKDVETTVGKLKGSRIDFRLAASGAGTGFATTLAKGADAALVGLLNSLSDVLAVVTLPYPAEPVGVGAMWMATTREAVLGIDTVSYRLVKVRSVSGDRVTLEVNARRYAADGNQVVPGITAEGAVDLQQFKAEGTGVVTVGVGAGIPDTGTVQFGLRALILVGQQPRPMMLQEQVRFVLGSPAVTEPEPEGPVMEP